MDVIVERCAGLDVAKDEVVACVKKAAVAVGHSILVIAWHLLDRGRDDQDLGGDWFVRNSDPERHKLRLVKQLQDLGYSVTLHPAA